MAIAIAWPWMGRVGFGGNHRLVLLVLTLTLVYPLYVALNASIAKSRFDADFAESQRISARLDQSFRRTSRLDGQLTEVEVRLAGRLTEAQRRLLRTKEKALLVQIEFESNKTLADIKRLNETGF